MKLIVLACLATVALARPQQVDEPVEILLDRRSDDGAGNFAYEFETADGTYQNVEGRPGEMTGTYRFTFPDGSVGEVTYIANDQGFQPSSDLLPVAPAMPDHVLETLRLIDELVAQGVTWDEQGFRINRKK